MRSAVASGTIRLGALGGAKEVYKSMITHFITNVITLPSASIGALLTSARADLPELTRAGPAQELAAFLQGYALQHGTLADVEEMRTLTESAEWYGLAGPLMALVVVDDSTLASDAEVEAAFGCDTACDFTSVDFTVGGYPNEVENCEKTQCILLQTGASGEIANAANEDGNVGEITLKFENFPDIVYPAEHLVHGESRTYCFPDQPLIAITVSSPDNNAWMGTITMVESSENPIPIGQLQCVDCECTDDPCPIATNILIGIDGDADIIGNMNAGDLPAICRNGEVCTISNQNYVPSVPTSCLVFTTTLDQGRLNLEMEFENQPVVVLSDVYVADFKFFSYCFPTGDLLSYTVQAELLADGGNGWAGDVSITHSHSNTATLTLCTANCDCECETEEGSECPGPCQLHESFELGLDDDGNVAGDTKCLNEDVCSFEVTWIAVPQVFQRSSELVIDGTENQIFGSMALFKNWELSYEFMPTATATTWQSMVHLTDDPATTPAQRMLSMYLIPNTLSLRMHYTLNELSPFVDFPLTNELTLNEWNSFLIAQKLKDDTYVIEVTVNGQQFDDIASSALNYKTMNIYSTTWWNAALGSLKNFELISSAEEGTYNGKPIYF